jgi:hypothetical protein
MSSKPNLILILGLALGTMLFAVRSDADIFNGSFENQFNGWTSVGPNSAVANGTVNGFDATDGVFYASLRNDRGSLPVGTQDSIFASVGLPSNYIASAFPTATTGGTLFQTFTLAAGRNAVRFNWNFLTDEFANTITWNDSAFALLFNQTTNSIAGEATLDTFSPLVGGGPQFANETGWLTQTFGGLNAGDSYTLAFGVFNLADTFAASGLLVDNVVSIPEPNSAMAMVVIGLATAGLRRRSRQ